LLYDTARALELLRIGTGDPTAVFREGQEDAIRYVVNEPGRLLVVQKTGWGKSFVYFIATMLLRESGQSKAPALLISPLLSLMRNQIDAATRMGLRAETISSANTDGWEKVASLIDRDEVDILLISPERLANQKFRQRVFDQIVDRVSLLIIDEVHNISDWGHDFRPNYRQIERITKQLPPNYRLLATTATANQRVMDDLDEVLGPELAIIRGELDRPSLTLQTLRLDQTAERLAWLAQALPRLDGTGIVYVLTKRDTILVADWLKSQDIDVRPYSGDTGEQRPKLEKALQQNEIKALISTSALGMGYDKPDLSFVIHYQAPNSVVSYYQQVGRAGRAIKAHGILLSGSEETEIHEYFRKSAFPTRDEAGAVIQELDKSDLGLSKSQLLGLVNIKKSRLEKTLQLLSLESPAPVVQEGSKWRTTASTLSEKFWERIERITKLREIEEQELQTYVDLDSGHMKFLVDALDGKSSNTNYLNRPVLTIDLDSKLIQEALMFLNRTGLPIEPRKQWPHGGMPIIKQKGKISKKEQVEEGYALCKWGDPGLATFVKEDKQNYKHFRDELVSESAKRVRELPIQPEWVCWIPSFRHKDLVPSFAKRLANELGLEAVDALQIAKAKSEQKSLQNWIQQGRNVDGAFAITEHLQLLNTPVLLVDDIVDSRWTLTMAGWLLRSNGSGPVVPFVLADAGNN
jgi:ATP-dependent DNA helicase RecQ